MKYWIDKNSELDNFVILNDSSLVIASCDEASITSNEKKILDGDSLDNIFGSDNFQVIAFSQIFKLVARSTDTSVDVDYNVKKGEENKLVDFESIDVTQDFLKAVERQLPERLKKKEFQQSFLSAGLPALLSFITALGVSAMFINKFRWLTLAIGGIWALASLYRLFTRVTKPPLITQWSSKSAVGSAWSQIKTASSLALLAIIVFAFSTRFPNSYGETAFTQHMDHDELEASDVPTLLKNGGDINALSDYGSRALNHAIYSEDPELFRALLDNGADPSLQDDQGSDALDDAVYQNETELAEYLLSRHSASLDLRGKLSGYVANSVTPATLTVLFDNGFDPKETDKDGKNALQVALENFADYDVVSNLLENKVPSDVKLEGRSLKQYALDNGQDDVARLFDERSVNYEQERNLTAQIDAFYERKIKKQLSEMTGVAKVLIGTESLTDGDTKELAQEMSKSLQYQSLRVVGNHRILSAYAIGCEKSGFEDAINLKKLQADRARKLGEHRRISELIIERNRSIYNEAKGEFVIPTDFQAKIERSASAVEKRYANADKLGENVAALNKKCGDVYNKVMPRKNT